MVNSLRTKMREKGYVNMFSIYFDKEFQSLALRVGALMGTKTQAYTDIRGTGRR